jgi:methionyl-tRNA formyltransferase
MNSGAKLIFFGNERLASGMQESGVILKSLLANGYNVTHLVINQKPIQSRSKQVDAVVEIAQKHSIPVVDNWDEATIIRLAQGADAGILAAFGRIISPNVISAFTYGIINVHPSLLPKLRGSTPIESAILDGATVTGVSIMALSAKMDAGKIYAQDEVALEEAVSKQDLCTLLTERGAKLLVRELPGILDGGNSGESQNDSLATYCSQLSKADAQVDWNKPSDVLEREVRAYLGWPGSKTIIAGKEVTLLQVHHEAMDGIAGHMEAHPDGEIQVFCGQGSLLITSLKPAGKPAMSSKAFLAGNPL